MSLRLCKSQRIVLSTGGIYLGSCCTAGRLSAAQAGSVMDAAPSQQAYQPGWITYKLNTPGVPSEGTLLERDWRPWPVTAFGV